MTNALRLQIHLEEPLLATGVANGEENSSISLDYIPGSAIRGACVAAYVRRHKGQDLDTNAMARRLFFDGEVRFLNGYPALPTNSDQRALPRPLSWHMNKDEAENDRHDVHDYVFDDAEIFKKSKGEKRAFFWQEEQEPCLLLSPRCWTNVHNATLEDPMRKDEDSSNVFRYEALARGQDFVAYVVAEDKSLLEEVVACLPDGGLHLGGSQTAGYGLVTLTTARESSWQESERDYEVEEQTIVTLLSDAILRDAFGRATTDFNSVLRTALGKPAKWKPKKTFAKTRLVGGFNRKWGLPLPQQWAVAMGSTFVYAANDLDLSELEKLLKEGVGDRRNEGFGRIGVNLNGTPGFATAEPQAAVATSQTLSPTSAKLAQTMARRRFMQSADTEILNHLNEIDFEKKRQPQNTQLSRLRLVVRQAQRSQKLKNITDHLDSLRKPAADQFRHNRLEVRGESHPVTWERWLRDRAKNKDGLSLIKLNPAEGKWQIAGRPPAIDDEQQIEITCRLIEALLRKALKEAK